MTILRLFSPRCRGPLQSDHILFIPLWSECARLWTLWFAIRGPAEK